MNIEFDPGKDAINAEKHGVSLADSSLLEWSEMWVTEDLRDDYGEQRMVGFAPIGSRVYCLVYTRRGDAIRAISLRKANRREVMLYASKV